ncbi:hypothetical protein AVEN_204659-1, partial [Araneus ventricosus]
NGFVPGWPRDSLDFGSQIQDPIPLTIRSVYGPGPRIRRESSFLALKFGEVFDGSDIIFVI